MCKGEKTYKELASDSAEKIIFTSNLRSPTVEACKNALMTSWWFTVKKMFLWRTAQILFVL